MKEIEINIYSIVGNSFCVDAEDGERGRKRDRERKNKRKARVDKKKDMLHI